METYRSMQKAKQMVERVIDAAVRELGLAHTEPEYASNVTAQLRQIDVIHTWQLPLLEREDWPACVTAGVRCAVARVLSQDLNAGHGRDQEPATAQTEKPCDADAPKSKSKKKKKKRSADADADDDLVRLAKGSLLPLEAAAGGTAKKQKTKPGHKPRWVRGVKVTDVLVGGGAPAKRRRTCKIHYSLELASNGKEMDKTGKKPYSFRLGLGEVVKGMDIGIEGMRVGGERVLAIPSALGYGPKGVEEIPGGADLVFTIRLVEAK